MCGIAGFVAPRGSNADSMRATAAAMAATLRRRGPDAEGLWFDVPRGVALAHRRLAIVDTSNAGAQPMTSRNGRWVISYNGEVFNFLELRHELEGSGHGFQGHSDTEVILEAVAAWGVRATVQRLAGMFAIAIWDREEGRLYLVRDRLGIKPLCWGWFAGTFAFASETRALRVVPGFAEEIDREALGWYLFRGVVPAPRTIYRGAAKLLPGTILILDADSREPRIESYWTVAEASRTGAANPFRGTAKDAANSLDVLLRTVVRQSMVADVPLGAFLSGGVDSSTIVAMMQAESSRPVRTFTIGFEDPTFDEAGPARAVARHLATQHTEIVASDSDLRSVLPRLASIYDEPFSDSSQIPTMLVSELARQHVTVSLSGDGGDEVFGGYNRYLWFPALQARLGNIPRSVQAFGAGIVRSLPPRMWDGIAATLQPLLPRRLRQVDVGERLHRLANVLPAGDARAMRDRILGFWPPNVAIGASAGPDPWNNPAAWPSIEDPVRAMMAADAATYLPDDLLTKVDRASMHASLEVRVPLIDHRVVEFAATLPSAHLFADGGGKAVLRAVLDRYVPPALTRRPKWGFQVPIRVWLRGALRDWAEDLLDERHLRDEGYLDPLPIRRAWREHLSGRANRQHHLWSVLMFQAWLRHRRASDVPARPGL